MCEKKFVHFYTPYSTVNRVFRHIFICVLSLDNWEKLQRVGCNLNGTRELNLKLKLKVTLEPNRHVTIATYIDLPRMLYMKMPKSYAGEGHALGKGVHRKGSRKQSFSTKAVSWLDTVSPAIGFINLIINVE